MCRVLNSNTQTTVTEPGVWKWGTQKNDLPEAFLERHTCASLAGSPGAPFPRKKLDLGLAEMQFPTVSRGLLALFSLFFVDILSRSQFLLLPIPLFLCRSGQITRPIFSKSGEVRTSQTPCLRQWCACLFVCLSVTVALCVFLSVLVDGAPASPCRGRLMAPAVQCWCSWLQPSNSLPTNDWHWFTNLTHCHGHTATREYFSVSHCVSAFLSFCLSISVSLSTYLSLSELGVLVVQWLGCRTFDQERLLVRFRDQV